jgi:phospholipase D1/2
MGKVKLNSACKFAYADLIYYYLKGLIKSNVLTVNRFKSFSPIHFDCKSKVYPNGYEDNYFEDLYLVLTKAKFSVYITDWFFSPQIYLKRPIEKYPDSRLDRVLSALAEKGVKIYILLYGEDPKFLYNGSQYVTEYLN